MTWVPGKTSIHVIQLKPTLFEPLGAIPLALTRPSMAWFIAWRLKRSILGNVDGVRGICSTAGRV